jgi:formate/nitrite transporter FocA (FNT family)
MAIIFPITAFVTIGSEHSVANMYFIPYGLFIQQFDPGFVAGLGNKVSLESLSWSAFFLKNLLPVTIGNIIGGALLVGILYWLIYLQGTKDPQTTKP